MGIFKRRQQLPQNMDPSDALITLCGLEGEEQRLLAAIVLDYQGGGLTTSPKSVEILQRVPSLVLEKKMKENVVAMLDAFTEVDGSTFSQGLVHGIFVTSLWDSLEMSQEDVLPIHRGISAGTISAIVRLLQPKRLEDAVSVALLGQCLYMNATAWQESLI